MCVLFWCFWWRFYSECTKHAAFPYLPFCYYKCHFCTSLGCFYHLGETECPLHIVSANGPSWVVLPSHFNISFLCKKTKAFCSYSWVWLSSFGLHKIKGKTFLLSFEINGWWRVRYHIIVLNSCIFKPSSEVSILCFSFYSTNHFWSSNCFTSTYRSYAERIPKVISLLS